MHHTHHKVHAAPAHVRRVQLGQGSIRFIYVRRPAGHQHRRRPAGIERDMMPQFVRFPQRYRIVLSARHQDKVHVLDCWRRLRFHRTAAHRCRTEQIEGVQKCLNRVAGQKILAGRQEILRFGQHIRKSAN